MSLLVPILAGFFGGLLGASLILYLDRQKLP
jgi:hypothetical protein